MSNIAALEFLAKSDPLIDNHAPRISDILIDADAEICSSEWNRGFRCDEESFGQIGVDPRPRQELSPPAPGIMI